MDPDGLTTAHVARTARQTAATVVVSLLLGAPLIVSH